MKLFVGNLSYEATEPEIRELFADHGPILDFARPIDRETGRPRGFAFVTLIDAEAGEKAMQALDGIRFAGRSLRVNEAEQRAPRMPNLRQLPPEDDITSGAAKPVDDRPTDKRGRKVVYKSI